MTHATIGDNNPPEPIDDTQDPIDAVIAEFGDTISEAQNWADGEPVEDAAGMAAVDAVLREFKTYKTALAKAGKERTDPLHKAWKAEVAAVKVYTEDADLMQKALVAVVAPFKAKEAARVEEERRKAWAETERLRREAEEQAAQARAGDIEQQREAAAAKQAALDAEKAAKATAKTAPKGLRTVTRYEIEDERAALHWIARNDKAALQAFIAEYVRKNHKTASIEGVKVWQEKEAY